MSGLCSVLQIAIDYSEMRSADLCSCLVPLTVPIKFLRFFLSPSIGQQGLVSSISRTLYHLKFFLRIFTLLFFLVEQGLFLSLESFHALYVSAS